MVKIRLSRHGSHKKPFYKIIVTDSRSARNGRFIEKIGFFNPICSLKDRKFKINFSKVNYWEKMGAKLSKRVQHLIKFYK
ncbi:30S ribosomal protein S16 [Buchnera aphidicola]|uniref:30S ribosomal protein S16 n=1 Tax=Buchnera aphidicola TaxID=9 RepID=UPI003463948E